MQRVQPKSKALVLILTILSFVLVACSTSQAQPARITKIAVINYLVAFDPAIEAFKAGLKEAGLVEGTSVVYLYNGVIANDNKVIDAEIEKLLGQNPDLFLTVGSASAARIKDPLQKANKPGVFMVVTQPDKLGIVKDLLKPGGKVTGVFTGGPATTKGLEWLVTVSQGIKRVHIYYRKGDVAAPTQFEALQATANKLKVELVLHEATTPEEVIAALPSLTRGTDAILQIPLPILSGPQQFAYLQQAREMGIPVGSTTAGGTGAGLLTGLTFDNTQLGKQTARLALQIINGADPGTLPIEPAQFAVDVNTETAKVLGLTIPDSMLQQANTVTRAINTPVPPTAQPTAQATSAR
jgi:putative ABC transport system substrate-binding protein